MSLYKRLHAVQLDQQGGPSPAELRTQQEIFDAMPQSFSMEGVTTDGDPYGATGVSRELKIALTGASLSKWEELKEDANADPQAKLNQDSLYIDNKTGLFVVADGMGGHAAGEEASRLVTHAFAETFKLYDSPDVASAIRNFEVALSSSRMAVGDRQLDLNQQTHNEKMGSTVTAGIIVEDTLVAVNAGDSAILVERQGTIIPITTEQCRGSILLNGIVGSSAPGVVTVYEHQNQGRQNPNNLAHFDEIITFELEPGDRIITATDGILGDSATQRLEDVDYVEALAGRTPLEAANALVDKTIFGKKKIDDTTVIVVDYKPLPAANVPMPAPTPLPVPPSRPRPAAATPNIAPPPPSGSEDEITIEQLQAEIDEARAAYVKAFVEQRIGITKLKSHEFRAIRSRYRDLEKEKAEFNRTELYQELIPRSPKIVEETVAGIVEMHDTLMTYQINQEIMVAARDQYVELAAKGGGSRHQAKLAAAYDLYVEKRDELGAQAARYMRAARPKGDDPAVVEQDIEEFRQASFLHDAEGIAQAFFDAQANQRNPARAQRRAEDYLEEIRDLDLSQVTSYDLLDPLYNYKEGVLSPNTKRILAAAAIAAASGVYAARGR